MIVKAKTTTTKRLLAVLVAVSLFAVIFAGCTSNGGTESVPDVQPDLRTDNPELFLEQALQRSGFASGNVFAGFSDDLSIFDLSRFGGSPTEHNLSVRIDQVDPNRLLLPGRPQLDLSMLMDSDTGNLLVGFDIIDAGIFSFADNRLFVSGDLLAVRVPGLHDQYITVNPNTFADDWSASNFSTLIGEINPGVISAVLSALEGMSEFSDSSDTSELGAQFERLAENLAAAGQFRDGGDTTITVGTNTHNAAVLGYYVSSQEINDFANSALDVVTNIAFVDGIIGTIAMMNPNADADTFRAAIQSFIESLNFNFPAGAYIYHYVDIDTGLVLRSRVPDTRVVIGSGGGTEEITLEAVTYYLGEQNLADITHTFITLVDNSGNTAEIEVRLYLPEGGPYVMHMHIDGAATAEIGFDPSGGENNFWFELELIDRVRHIGFDVRGSIADSADEFALRNARTSIITDGTTTFAASFDYSLRNATAADVSFDHTQAISLFELDLLQLLRISARLGM